MRTISLLIGMYLLASNVLPGQQPGDPAYEQWNEQALAGEVFYPSFSYSGSQYDPEEWSMGSVFLENGESVDKIMLRYNGFLDELILLKTENFQQIKLDKYLIREFHLHKEANPRKLVFRRITVNLPPFPSKSEIFAELLVDDQISLYAYRRISLLGTIQKKTDKGIFKSHVIGPDHLYFINIPGEGDVYLKNPSRKNIYAAFPAIKQELRSAFKHSRGMVSNEGRLVVLVELLNQSLSADR
jgi:hypothetical protein